jgi:hypothetical protein
MDIYAGLFDSMLACCGRIGLRQGPVYTVAMMALGLGVSFNILSVIDLLWTLGILNNPYQRGGSVHPQRYLWALLCIAFVVNTLLARHKFSADTAVCDLQCRAVHDPPRSPPPTCWPRPVCS